MRMSFLALGLLSTAPATAQTAQPASTAWECRDDRGRDRCDAAAIIAQDQLFGVAPLSTLNADGTLVRRAFYVDGYGQDVLAISFAYPRGGNPELVVTVPQTGPDAPPPLRVAIHDTVWRAVVSSGRHFDRELAPLAANTAPNAPIAICLHSWVTRIEASDPPVQSPNVGGPQRTANRMVTHVRGACGESLHADYATALAATALAAMPLCSLISAETQRNPVTQLATCARLRGDRSAAARAYNAAQALTRFDARMGDEDPRPGWSFSENAVFTADGVSRAQGRGVGSAFIRWMRGYSRMRISPGQFTGIDRDSATSLGTITHLPEPNGASFTAPMTIRWTQRFGDMVIERIEIGRFAPNQP